jgi:heme-degrading monooxygenase HmoA
MILEVAILNIIVGKEAEFETAFQSTSRIIMSMNGYIAHQLQRCLEKQNQYLLLVNWCSLEDHSEGFRGSIQYQEWRALLHRPHQLPFPAKFRHLVIGGILRHGRNTWWFG